jgi:GTP cyclohydrolase IA
MYSFGGTNVDIDRGAELSRIARTLLFYVEPDTEREGVKDTPRRFSQAWIEMTEGYKGKPKITTFDAEGADQMICQWDIPVLSNCEHHLLPFVGYAHIGYIPKDKIIGLSKFALVVDMFARRLQNQERMTRQIAEYLEATLEPRGVIVVAECEHLCMVMRKRVPPGTKTTTSAVTGDFLNPKEGSREEFMSLLNRRRA